LAVSIRASLRLQLLADEVVIAESDDQVLWQKTLAAIAVGRATPDSPPGEDASGPPAATLAIPERSATGGDGAPLGTLADDIGVPEAALVASCNPTLTAPFMELDPRYWEAFRRNMPLRGPTAVGPIQLACTLLALWARRGGFGPVTVAQGIALLATIDVTDRNAYRSIANCAWLQRRGGGVVVNPVEFARATAVARVYCTRQPPTQAAGGS
jgi:hypothetical protein